MAAEGEPGIPDQPPPPPSRTGEAYAVRTLEIRWFIPGEIPAAVRDWAQAQGLTPVPTRRDQYIVLPDGGSVGIKLREGRVEVKARTGEPVDWRQGALGGGLEPWVKWSQPVEVAGGWGAPEGIRAVTLSKTRMVRWEPAPMVEVTALGLDSGRWWTVALEASDAAGTDLSQEAVAPGLEQLAGLPGAAALLSPDRSMGYPAWLAGLPTGASPR